MRKIKSSNGITIVSLIMVIIIVLILSTVSFYSINSSQNIGKYNKMIADITLLEDKILIYYNKYGEMPIIINEKETIDNIDYYKIDLGKLENITLNYGIDESDDNDIYLVNTNIQVYYKKGIEKAGTIYHTKE